MTEHTSEIEELLNSEQAADYLAKKWGIPSYSMDAFRALRSRWHIKPALGSKTATFWRKSDLDTIPKPDRSRPRGKRVKKNGGDSAQIPSVLE
jgi:hypothetical protein